MSLRTEDRKDNLHLKGVRIDDTSVDFLEGEGVIIGADESGEVAISLGADGVTPGEYPYQIWPVHQDTATRSDVALTGLLTAEKTPLETWIDMYKEPLGDPYHFGMPLAWTFAPSQVREAAGDDASYGVLCPAIELVDGSDRVFVYGEVIVPPLAANNNMMKVRLSDNPSQMTLT
jgi:hypothetical protein